jgi:hypothetical protein
MKSTTTVTKSLAVLACAALLASCAKRKDNTVDQTAKMGKATITGRVTARLVDTVGAASSQNAPAGTVINAWIDTRDLVLNPDPTATYANKYYTTTTDANGYYSFTIEVSPYKAANVHMLPSDFEANVLKKYTTGANAGTLYNERHVFHAQPVGDHVGSDGQTSIVDITYN